METNDESLSLGHLLGRLEVVEERVRELVSARRSTDPEPHDLFRGLYVSDADVDRLLSADVAAAPGDGSAPLFAAVEARGDEAEREGARLRLRHVARSFGLDTLDIEILLIALLPDLDARFERVYGYLNDDVTQRRPTIGLALEVCGVSPISAEARARFADTGPLLEYALLQVEDRDRPFLTRTVCVSDRVTAYLLGDDRIDPALAPWLAESLVLLNDGANDLGAALRAGARLCYVRELPGASARALAHGAIREAGLPTISLDVGDVPAEELASTLRSAVREALLEDAALVVGPAEALMRGGQDVVRPYATARAPVVLCGTARWDPSWSREMPLVTEALPLTEAERAERWSASLDGELADGVDVIRATSQFRLSPVQIANAARAATLHAAVSGAPIGQTELAEACREQNAAGLERLARRIDASVCWDDIVLPAEPLRQLREIASRARWRGRVLDEWGMGGGSTHRRGISALFVGPSGTGKTMAAEVIANDLELDLYRVDLASVVDKYIGETEKNLGRIFDEAEGVSGVLLFDEADALFGRRSEVRDSHDRYANIEVAYLLQRMESFNGVAILATNMRANLDEAFTRRLDVIVSFPLPDQTARQRIWELSLPPVVPRSAGIDFAALARSFDISGGDIRNACLAAVYHAAAEERALRMDDLFEATEREYRKLGRLDLERQ